MALHGQRTDGDDAIERCLKRRRFRPAGSKSLLNLASPGSSSPSHALRSSRTSEERSTRRRGRARVRMRAHPGPSQGRRDGCGAGGRTSTSRSFSSSRGCTWRDRPGRTSEPLRPLPRTSGRARRREGRVVPVVGLLMHAMEYPPRTSAGFELDLGRCHFQSSCAYDPAAMGENVRTADEDGPSSARSIPRRGRRSARGGCASCLSCTRRSKGTSGRWRGMCCIFTHLSTGGRGKRSSPFLDRLAST